MGRVKWDRNPKNDYGDGYNAGRRYNKPINNLSEDTDMQPQRTRSEAVWETAKFVLRLAVLAGIPILIAEAGKLGGYWEQTFQVILPIVLPILDKFIHEDPQIKARGLVPF